MPRIPCGIWGWRSTTLLTLVVFAPPLEALAGAGSRTVSLATSISGLVTYSVVLAAAALLYVQCRLAATRSTIWLVAGLTMVGVQGLSWAALHAGHPAGQHHGTGWFVLVDLALVLGVLLAALAAHRVSLPCDPVAAGILTGVVATGAHLALVEAAPQFTLGQPMGVAVAVLVVSLVVAALLRLPDAPTWVRVRLSVAVVMLGVFHAVGSPDPASPARSWTVLLIVLTGAVVLCATSLAWLRVSIRDGHRHVLDLRDHLDQVEARVRTDRERLHEINTTIAGIASASHLIHGGVLPADRLEVLRHMVESEMSRLELLMCEREQVELSPVDLDATIEPLVVAQQVRGRPVSWVPSGQCAQARHEDIATVVNILLNNAADHAPTARVVVEVRRVADPVAERVEVCVADDGPGISPLVRSRLFEWAARGGLSSGQGIGLSIAERLMCEQGGYLRLLNTQGPGTTFVAGLMAEHEADVRAVAG